jgi:hypothetical protein
MNFSPKLRNRSVITPLDGYRAEAGKKLSPMLAEAAARYRSRINCPNLEKKAGFIGRDVKRKWLKTQSIRRTIRRVISMLTP